MKYFVVSDTHSFANELKASLRQAGYNKRNKEHILIVCGDIFDRGEKTLALYNYVASIPKKRRILIRGNHEILFLELLKKSFPERYDFSNRTVKTFCHIAQMPEDVLEPSTYEYNEQDYWAGARKAWQQVVARVKDHPITAWLQTPEWVNYYELGKYIFVHAFIPIEAHTFSSYLGDRDIRQFLPWWRAAEQEMWDAAVWQCPWELYKDGLFRQEEANGKVLVCGHWHTADFYQRLKAYHGFDLISAPIYYSKGLIGLDGGVVRTWDGKLVHHQNVLVINDPESYDCYDEAGNKMVEMEEKVKRIIRTVTVGEDSHELPSQDDFIKER